jgi:hypothetical protein
VSNPAGPSSIVAGTTALENNGCALIPFVMVCASRKVT